MKSKINILSLFSFLLIISISSCASNESTIQNEAEILTENTKLTESTTETETEKPKESKKKIESKASSQSLVEDESASSKSAKKKMQTNVTLNWPWRGITIVSQSDREVINENSIKKLADYGVNLIRLRVSFRKYQEKNNIDKVESWENTIEWCRRVISICSNNNISVLISHSDFPLDSKKKHDDHSKLFWEDTVELKQSIIDIERIVKTFDTIKGVVAYEFFSEPLINNNNKSYKPANWDYHFQQILKSVRNISSKHLLYTPGPGGLPSAYSKMKKPLDDEKIIYNFHFYQPHKYTHQGVKGRDIAYGYPGKFGKHNWNKDKINQNIDIVYNWQIKHNVKYIFAGEFSVVRWAENKDLYLKDLLDVLEAKKIGWAYFSFNGWKGWDVKYEYTLGSEKETKYLHKSSKETATLSLLKTYWIKNKNK